MDKDEILEKNRRDNGEMDERFKIMQQRMSLIATSILAVAFVLLFFWDFYHGQETNGLCAVFMVGTATMAFVQFYQLRMKASLFFGGFAVIAAIVFAVNHILATM